MLKNYTLLSVFLICFTSTKLSGQIDGDNIFDTNQVITIELDFSQAGFWDSLVLNYDSGTYMKADLTLTDITGTSTINEVGVRLKGNSSYSHPGNKKSFKIDFNEYVSGQNYDGLKKLNFSNGFKDPTLMREKIFFDVCQTANVPAPRANFANVYFNGTLWGFYTVIEQIDDQFLDWRILDDDGNLFKAGDNFGGGGGNEADLRYYGTDQSSYETRYELKSNEDENDWSDLIQFTDFINNSSSFENELANHIELTEYLRSAALDNLFSNLDSYTQSARNYYIYHNLTTDKWEWIKWDGNEAFGSYGAGSGVSDMTSLPLNYHGNNRPLLENIFNSQVLYDQYLNEVCSLSDEYFNSDFMNPMIEELKSLIQESVYADDNKMYSNTNFDENIENNISVGGGPMGGTTYGLKSFIQQRNNYVSGQLDCSLISSVSEFTPAPYNIRPNPTSSWLMIEWEKNDVLSLVIYNNFGQEVYRENTAGKTQTELNLSNLLSGNYFISFISSHGITGEKIIIN